MNLRILLGFIFLLTGTLKIKAEGLKVNMGDSINKTRLVIVSGSFTASLYGAYYYVENNWWADQENTFHFDNGPDLTYALNVDKAGHFMGGLQSADIFASSMRWSGISNKKSLWYGAFFGSGLQLAIEIKDAYAPYWGFSKWDLAIGSAGAFWPLFQHYNDKLKAIKFKFSYYKHSNIYWELEKQRGKEVNRYSWQDDYPNQTYWISLDVNYLTDYCCWPDWLHIAVGFGLDDNQYLNNNFTKKGGNNEWYIALDYDIPKLLKNWDSSTAKTIKHWFNYFHFPSPTIRIIPKIQFYPLFL